MKKTSFDKDFLQKSEKGQAIILVAFAIIGLVAMVGLVTDTGLLMIEYGKLKRSVDAAAVAAAQEFRPDPDTGVLNVSLMENAARSMLQINQFQNINNIQIHTCEDTGADRPALCNPDPVNNPIENRKLVEVTATADVQFAFLRVLGINSAQIRVSSIGEAATIDLVLLIDTSGSMAYETSGAWDSSDIGDDPRVCNANDNCLPMREVKNVAMDFVGSLIYFGYDRVSVIAMTGQAANSTDAVTRDPVVVLPLSFDRNTILYSIDTLKVFQPRACPTTPWAEGDPIAPGECLDYRPGFFDGTSCDSYELPMGYQFSDPNYAATADPSSCTSSNVGGMLDLARGVYSGSGNSNNQRTQSLWVTVLLASGPANASTPSAADISSYPYGYCPQNTWLLPYLSTPKAKWCRDAYPDNERSPSSPLVNYTNPLSGEAKNISLYDAEDYARDMGDNLAAMKSGTGVTIYTIGLGQGVKKEANGDSGSGVGEGEHLLQYIARDAGNLLNSNINHGEYFFAPNQVTLRNIFEIIAQNIGTKISQ